jgi:FKBP-type peptidyl-prolyl cis-trans isomerase
VRLHYKGTLRDGTVFDNSADRGAPATFQLGGVVPCFREGLTLMKVGGKSRLVCPPELAYGERGFPPTIPPGATLTFEVELLGVVPSAADAAPEPHE